MSVLLILIGVIMIVISIGQLVTRKSEDFIVYIVRYNAMGINLTLNLWQGPFLGSILLILTLTMIGVGVAAIFFGKTVS